MTQLFPHLPSHLLVAALNHRIFAHIAGTPEEQAAPLVDIILRGGAGLPDELGELRQAVQRDFASQTAAAGPSVMVERRNIWAEEELDLSRLRLGKDESSVTLAFWRESWLMTLDSVLPHIGTAIPDHLRASILRLAESQAEEAEAQAAALREGHDNLEDDGVSVVRIRGDGEESGDDDEIGDKVVVRALPNPHLLRI